MLYYHWRCDSLWQIILLEEFVVSLVVIHYT